MSPRLILVKAVPHACRYRKATLKVCDLFYCIRYPMSLESVTARLPREMLEEIEATAEREKVDRSELIRRLLDAALRQRRIEEAVRDYRDGRVTLWRASGAAGLSLMEMMEIVKERKVPVPYTLDDLDRDLEHVRRGGRGKQ